ncbi:MAG: methyltransferase domain-containing protein [Nitrospiraceae bacterium]|nr:MAG: methyltransferase domain-containing protein [Nitrospiraceae bacterium]
MKNKSDAEKHICPVCCRTDISVFIDIARLPVHCSMLWPTQDGAVKAPRGDIRLAHCRFCGHIFNLAFDPGLMKYDQDYENSLHFSPRFQEYAGSLAGRLIDRYDLHDMDILEIGCGKGDFLRLLCELGGNRGVGFDPSYDRDRTGGPVPEGLTFVQDFYSDRYADCKADLICCRHVLEHIQYPRDFLTGLRGAIGGRLGIKVFFEVPNALFTLKDLSIWDLIYEHCSYFTEPSLAYLFTSCGFRILDISESFEGQFLCIEAGPVTMVDGATDYGDYRRRISRYAGAFSARYRSRVEAWKNEIGRIGRAEKRLVIWGGGSKGVTFLNTLGVKDESRYVVDINPHKHGKYIPGTGQEIVPPEFLSEYKPEIIVVMNPVYIDEICRAVRGTNVDAGVVPV